jgi:AAA+ ATPase superfamily predicted ATPase
MKNSLGHPARGEAFYPREREVKKIYRVLNSGTSIYLSAPRRVGKTSILRYIEEFAAENYYFIYVITESIDNENDFFKAIFEELVKSEAIGKLAKLSTAVKDAVAGILGRVKQVYHVEIREAGETDYYEILVQLFSKIKPEMGRVVLLIDEFPQTILNILNKEGSQQAEKFLQRNRELRHHQHLIEKINFVYTGSMSLHPIVSQVTQLTAVNDLRTVEVKPLSQEEAEDFLQQLLKADGIVLNGEVLNYVLQRINWLIPFHLQLLEQEIVDVFELTGEEITKETVDKAFEQVVHTRNKPQFEPYFARLKTVFKGREHEFVSDLLQAIANDEEVHIDVINDKAVKYEIAEYKSLLDILEGDGYIFLTEDKTYRYTSPILRLWCQKHICK